MQSKKTPLALPSTSRRSVAAPRREWTPHLPSLPPSVTHHVEVPPLIRPALLPVPPISRALPPMQRARASSRAKESVTPVMYEFNTSLPSVSSASAVELHARSHPVRQTHLSHFVLDNRPKTSPEKLYVVGHSLAQEIHKETKEMCRILGEVRRRHWSQEVANRSDHVTPPLAVAAASSEQSTSQASKKSKRWRCSQCRRKLNITNAHTCRCGKHFCAAHRYAETHSCTYDYKADGKKFLAQANPLVIATKLPKI